MAKEILIPQGTYTVGVDFPAGTYIFDSMENSGMFDFFKKTGKDEDNKYYELNENSGYKCRITLKDRDYFVIDTQMKVTKAEMISFD